VCSAVLHDVRWGCYLPTTPTRKN